MDWISTLSDNEKEYFDKWIKTYDCKGQFFTWMNEKKVHESGNPFYGRAWDDHVASCKKLGKDPYD